MAQWANPSRALAICDTCGTRWKRNQLKYLVIAGKSVKQLVCPECDDKDNQQLLLDKLRLIDDPTPVFEARPDHSYPYERGGFSWNPVGGIGLSMTMYPTCLQNDQVINNPTPPGPTPPAGYGFVIDPFSGAFIIDPISGNRMVAPL